MQHQETYRIMGIDPGTNYMGYGVLEIEGRAGQHIKNRLLNRWPHFTVVNTVSKSSNIIINCFCCSYIWNVHIEAFCAIVFITHSIVSYTRNMVTDSKIRLILCQFVQVDVSQYDGTDVAPLDLQHPVSHVIGAGVDAHLKVLCEHGR